MCARLTYIGKIGTACHLQYVTWSQNLSEDFYSSHTYLSPDGQPTTKTRPLKSVMENDQVICSFWKWPSSGWVVQNESFHKWQMTQLLQKNLIQSVRQNNGYALTHSSKLDGYGWRGKSFGIYSCGSSKWNLKDIFRNNHIL
jgi:hypothetical protein